MLLPASSLKIFKVLSSGVLKLFDFMKSSNTGTSAQGRLLHCLIPTAVATGDAINLLIKSCYTNIGFTQALLTTFTNQQHIL